VWDIVIRGAVDGALFALIASGLNLQYGVTKILNVAHGEFLMLGAFITSVLFRYYGINPLVSLAISGCLVLVVGVLVYMLVFRRIIKQSRAPEELEVRSLLACFGLMLVISYTLSAIVRTDPKLKISTTDFLREPITILGVTIELNKIVALFVAIAFSVVLYVLLRFTKIGLAMRAAAQEPTGAQLVGINLTKSHLISFSLSAFLGAVSGSLLSMVFYTMSPLSGAQYTFIALTVIVIGGAGSFIGSLVGGFIMGYIYYYVLTMPKGILLSMPVVYAFLIVMLLVRPKGLFGR